MLQSQQLQAILNGLDLMVQSTAQMSEVSGFLKETAGKIIFKNDVFKFQKTS